MSRNYRFFRGKFGHDVKSSGDKICGQRRLLLTDGKLFQRALHRCKSFSLNKAALSKKFYTTTNNSTCMPFLPLEAGYRQNIHVLYCPQISEEKSAWPKNGVAWLKQARRRLGQENVKQAVDYFAKQQLCTCSTPFWSAFLYCHGTGATWNFTLYGGRKSKAKIFWLLNNRQWRLFLVVYDVQLGKQRER